MPSPKAPTEIFGLSPSKSDPKLVIFEVPFEATTSYLGGTSKAPSKVFDASFQVDLFHPQFPEAWKKGIRYKASPSSWRRLNTLATQKARRSRKSAQKNAKLIREVNKHMETLRREVAAITTSLLEQKQIPAVLGGDHSCPLGAIEACVNAYPKMGVLHLDAHHDLRKAYEGFTQSHASIFYNVLESTALETLVQVGIRDYSEEEFEYAKVRRVKTFYAQDLFDQKFSGMSWASLSDEIIQALPENVYVSFDIDGLDPSFCPSTGTPVPGGLEFSEVVYLLRRLVKSGRKIIGFDLVEVGPNEYDANVAARLLYELSCLSLQ